MHVIQKIIGKESVACYTEVGGEAMKSVESIDEAITTYTHRLSVEHAWKVIFDSPVFPYIQRIILYGSCARKEQKWKSDVDLLLILEDDAEPKIKFGDLHQPMIRLRSDVTPDDWELPSVDLHATFASIWNGDVRDTYHKNIRKDGIVLWERQPIMIMPMMTENTL